MRVYCEVHLQICNRSMSLAVDLDIVVVVELIRGGRFVGLYFANESHTNLRRSRLQVIHRAAAFDSRERHLKRGSEGGPSHTTSNTLSYDIGGFQGEA